MKKGLIILSLLILIGVVDAQTQATVGILNDVPTVSENLLKKGKIGSHLLREKEAAFREYLDSHPEMLREQKLQKGAAWNFKVGDKKSWWARNFLQGVDYQVAATCVGVGSHCYVFREDATSGRVPQFAADAILKAFDVATPANPNKGVYQTDIETFGSPPDVDSDPRVIILILDIRDGYDDGGSSFIGGYFAPWNEYRDGSFAGYRSNEAEIYYMDCDPVDLTNSVHVEWSLGVTAHEFQHMIHWNYDRNEIVFLNEGLSETASKICGYDIAVTSSEYYTTNPNVYLFRWGAESDVNADYARAARFGMYLWNQFPNGYLKQLVASTATGIDGINDALGKYQQGNPSGGPRYFEQVLQEWAVANYLNDVAVDPRYGYTNDTPLSKPVSKPHLNPNSSAKGSVDMLGVDYVTFKNCANLSITFTSDYYNDLRVFAIEISRTAKRVTAVPLGSVWNEPAADAWSEITFVVVNTSTYQSAAYSYNATGKILNSTVVFRQENESGSSPGYLQVAANDTIAVLFSGVEGAILDSVCFAARRTGVIKYGLWEYSGAVRPSPSGKQIVPLSSFTVAAADTNQPPTVEATTRWAKIDLRSFSADLSRDFLIEFAIVSKTAPGVLVSEAPHNGQSGQSFTYLNAASPPDWYYFTNSDASLLYLYLVRAYGHFSTPTGVEKIEFVPKVFSLGQNYPNPFNPRTAIEFSVPQSGFVKLKVFDMLGREVETLIAQELQAGSYKVFWSGSGKPSGIYFYRLDCKNFTEVRRMTLLK